MKIKILNRHSNRFQFVDVNNSTRVPVGIDVSAGNENKRYLSFCFSHRSRNAAAYFFRISEVRFCLTFGFNFVFCFSFENYFLPFFPPLRIVLLYII